MIVSKGFGYQAVKASLFATWVLSSWMSCCRMAYCRTEKSESKLFYDAKNKRLMVVASKPQQQLVDAILKRVVKTTKR